MSQRQPHKLDGDTHVTIVEIVSKSSTWLQQGRVEYCKNRLHSWFFRAITNSIYPKLEQVDGSMSDRQDHTINVCYE